MILTTTKPKAAIAFTPEWRKGDDNPATFLLRAGTVIEREMMEAELAGELLAGPVWPWELHEAILSGFRELGGEGAETLISLAEADQAGALESEEEKQQLAEAIAILARHWPPYKRLRQQQTLRNGLLPAVAFRHFCVGWENVPHAQEGEALAVYAAGFDKCVTADAMEQIDPLDLRAAGLRAYSLQYGGGEEKNSAAPSKSADDPAISTMGAQSKTDGSSEASTIPKTPG